MLTRPVYFITTLMAIGFITALPGCGTALPGDNTTGQVTPTPAPGQPTPTPVPGQPTPTPTQDQSPSSLTIVKTAIPVHVQARIAAGDDIIVYGYGAYKGVDYIVPSAADTHGRGITNGDTFDVQSFAVAGKKILLAKDDYTVVVFDTATGISTIFEQADIRLASLPTATFDAGHPQGDGNYFAMACDAAQVSSGKALAVIDASGTPPTLVTFAKDTLGTNDIFQVAVDGTAKKVAVAASDKFYIFNIADPAADPVVVDNPEGISTRVQMVFRNGKILYADYQKEYLRLADSSSGNITLMSVDPDGWDVPSLISLAMNGGKLGYFMDCYYQGVNHRSAVGTVAAAPSVTQAPDSDSATQIDGSTDNNGFVGWASTMAITPDGSKIFIAGWESIGQGEYLQYGTGGAFTVLQSANGDAWGFPASDVSASSNTVAFKGGTNEDTYVCYIKLQ